MEENKVRGKRSWIEVIVIISIVGIVIYWAEFSDNNSKDVSNNKKQSNVVEAADTTTTTKNSSSSIEKSSTPLRMITFEELSSKNGTVEANYIMWLSILSEVYDVTSAPNYYAPNSTYNIFTGRDANVPFVTGTFTEEEAAKSITTLSHHQQWIVEHFSNDTYKHNKQANYTFVGYLIGELYDETGNPTETLIAVRHNISIAAEEKRKTEVKRQAILAERRRKDAEKLAANNGVEPPPPPKVVIVQNINNNQQSEQQKQQESMKASEL